ncbi:TPA: hypothetical protein DEB02_00955 [Candidatus Beckwithbacteria bacterium]|nr:hypothetical protein [Candidatus Beckwithbacteria bacterium]
MTIATGELALPLPRAKQGVPEVRSIDSSELPPLTVGEMLTDLTHDAQDLYQAVMGEAVSRYSREPALLLADLKEVGRFGLEFIKQLPQDARVFGEMIAGLKEADFSWRNPDGGWNRTGIWNTIKLASTGVVIGGLVSACAQDPERVTPTQDGDDDWLGSECAGLIGAIHGLNPDQVDFAFVDANSLDSGELGALQADFQADIPGALVRGLVGGAGDFPVLGLAEPDSTGRLQSVWAVPVCEAGDSVGLGFIWPDLSQVGPDMITRSNGSLTIPLHQLVFNPESEDFEPVEAATPMVVRVNEAGEFTYELEGPDGGKVVLVEENLTDALAAAFLVDQVHDIVDAENELAGTPAFVGFNPEIVALTGLPVEVNGQEYWANSFELQDALNDQGLSPAVVTVNNGDGSSFNALSITKNGEAFVSYADQLYDPYDVNGPEDKFIGINDAGMAEYGDELDQAIITLPSEGLGDNVGIAAMIVTDPDKLPDHLGEFKTGTVIIATVDKNTNEVISAVRAIWEKDDKIDITTAEGKIILTVDEGDGQVSRHELTTVLESSVSLPTTLPEELQVLVEEKGLTYDDETNTYVNSFDEKRLYQNEAGDWVDFYQELIDNAPTKNFWENRETGDGGIINRDAWPVFTGETRTMEMELISGTQVTLDVLVALIADPTNPEIIRTALILEKMTDSNGTELASISPAASGGYRPIFEPGTEKVRLNSLDGDGGFLSDFSGMIAGDQLGISYWFHFPSILPSWGVKPNRVGWFYDLDQTTGSTRVLEAMFSGQAYDWPEDGLIISAHTNWVYVLR